MRKLLVIGIGVGDPDFVTIQAVNALNTVDVFFLLDKGPAAGDLTQARQAICERFITNDRYRSVTVTDSPRDRGAADYPEAVRQWRDRRAERLEQVIDAELGEHGVGGFLVWGDPSLYDGIIRVIETILERGVLTLEYEVIPGISSIQALAARHRIAINQVASPVHVTTGRRIKEGLPNNADDIVVMLDADLACAAHRDEDIDIYWGAYLGTEDEILVAGKLRDVIDHIAQTRAELRERKGWIMDTYLLRRKPGQHAE